MPRARRRLAATLGIALLSIVGACSDTNETPQTTNLAADIVDGQDRIFESLKGEASSATVDAKNAIAVAEQENNDNVARLEFAKERDAARASLGAQIKELYELGAGDDSFTYDSVGDDNSRRRSYSVLIDHTADNGGNAGYFVFIAEMPQQDDGSANAEQTTVAHLARVNVLPDGSHVTELAAVLGGGDYLSVTQDGSERSLYIGDITEGDNGLGLLEESKAVAGVLLDQAASAAGL